MTRKSQSTKKRGRSDSVDQIPPATDPRPDAIFDGSRTPTTSPTAKKRRSTSVSQIPPVLVQPNTTGTESYTKFGKLPPSPEIEAHLNGLINGAPVASLVNPTVAKLFTNVEVH
jgi:hypothetical protein